MRKPADRSNQKRRTRKDLLEAAARLMRQGRRPTLEEVAEEALISRATAYRYFPGHEALLLEAALDVEVPTPALFDGDRTTDPTARLKKADAAFGQMIAANEPQLRMMLIQALERSLKPEGDLPRRQNRRTPVIEAALAPAKSDFTPAALDRLVKALGLVMGTDAFVAAKDVLQISEGEAAKLRAWMIEALVAASQR